MVSLNLEFCRGSYDFRKLDDFNPVIHTILSGVHSDGDIKITAGVFEIQTGDDGVHADTTLDLGTQDGYDRDPMITVSTSYEGLEGGTVNIYSGKFYTVSSDDGINAAGGSSSGSGGGGTDPFRPGRPGWGASGDYTINVYGGHVYVDAKGDGLDSNGDLNLYGGDITVFSMAAGGDNSPLPFGRRTENKGIFIQRYGLCVAEPGHLACSGYIVA